MSYCQTFAARNVLPCMTNKIQQGAEIIIRFFLNAEETAVWKAEGWKAAGARGGVKRQARGLFRDTGRKVMILGCPDEAGERAVLWSSETDTVCEQTRRNVTR